MSAHWSVVYLEAKHSERDVFDAMVEAFRSELDAPLHHYWKLEPMIAEWGAVPPPAVKGELPYDPWYEPTRYVLLNSVKNGLMTLETSFLDDEDLVCGSRQHLKQLAFDAIKPNAITQPLLAYSRFLNTLTKTLNVQAAHLMFFRNPAIRATSVHFHDKGELVDVYHVEDADGEFHNVEVPKRIVADMFLGGRFAFLGDQPKPHPDRDDLEDELKDVEYFNVTYFDGEDLLTLQDGHPDIHNLQASQLPIPFSDLTCVGSIQCAKIPDETYNTAPVPMTEKQNLGQPERSFSEQLQNFIARLFGRG